MSDFLRALWVHPEYPVYDLYGELRILHNGTVEQEYFELGVVSLDTVMQSAIFHDEAGRDAYFGVMPRQVQDGKDEACVRETHVLWADVDGKHFDGGKAAALFALGKAQLTPSILVDSGNGWHAYWLLKGNFVPFEQAADTMRGLAKAIGGDAVYNASRILRLPGTHNHKTDPPNPVRLLHFEPDRRYAFTDFDRYVPEVEHKPRPINLTEPLPWGELPEWLREHIEQGAPKSQRSELDFKVCMYLLRFGWTEEQIRAIYSAYPSGIGSKWAEMTDRGGERYLSRTIARAREAL